MNLLTILDLLKDEDNKGIKIYLTNGEKINVSQFDDKLSRDNTLVATKPKHMYINLDYVVAIEPLASVKATMPIIK
ncbi:hypothetical protein V070_01806 [Staphylococcus aureus C0673]|nr:hypothetical protein V070_01806 [Staphylococcus aureus C0673]